MRPGEKADGRAAAAFFLLPSPFAVFPLSLSLARALLFVTGEATKDHVRLPSPERDRSKRAQERRESV